MKIAIASGKGGTGKTTLSVNLTSYLAIKENVTLVDLDVEEPNSGLFIQANLLKEEIKFSKKPEWFESRCTNCGQCQKVCNFNAIIQELGTGVIGKEPTSPPEKPAVDTSADLELFICI